MTARPVLFDQSQSWIKWPGGVCPVHPDSLVLAWFKSVGQAKQPYEAGQLNWGRRLDDGARLPGSILGYIVVRGAE